MFCAYRFQSLVHFIIDPFVIETPCTSRHLAVSCCQTQVLGAKNDRVEVEFDDGPKALKPSNLKFTD